MFNTRNKSGISAHPCIILYITFIQKVNKMLYVLVILVDIVVTKSSWLRLDSVLFK